MIRQATPDDFSLILSIGRARYTSSLIDWARGENWLHSALTKPAYTPCFIGRRAFLFLIISQPMWEPAPRAILSFFAALPGRDLEPLRLLRHAADYAKSRGCSSFEGGADTAVDLSPFWRRLGAQTLPRYRLEISPCPTSELWKPSQP